MLKIGDRVRFLNAVGGGIIRRFQDKNIVLVEEEDGFETPVLIRECVLVESINTETNLPQIKKQVQSAPVAPIIIRQEIEKEEEFEVEETYEGENITVFLAFAPQDIKQLQTTDYDAYLVNDSNYFLYYTVSTTTYEGQKLQAQGKIEPNTRLLLVEISKNELNDWEKINVQGLPYKLKAYTKKPAIDVSLAVNPVKFYKLHSFTENDYLEELALLLPIVQKDLPVQDFGANQEQLKELVRQKSDGAPRRARIDVKPQKVNAILEVDLHINELLDSTAGMSNADMLQYQLDKFHAVLAENKNNKGQKVVFIHGKGEGVLRNELMKQLKSKYSTYYVQDASFREYGFGATMVTIK